MIVLVTVWARSALNRWTAGRRDRRVLRVDTPMVTRVHQLAVQRTALVGHQHHVPGACDLSQ